MRTAETIEEHMANIIAPIQATGESLGYKGNKLQCYIKREVRKVIAEVKTNQVKST